MKRPSDSNERIVVSEFIVTKYTVLVLNENRPWIPWRRYLIDDVVYDYVMVNDLGWDVIAIEAQGGFVGKTVKFIP